MMKQAKRLWAVVALGVGLGMGFSAGARPTAQEPASEGSVECVRNSDCDARCGEPGSGVCESGRCVCAW